MCHGKFILIYLSNSFTILNCSVKKRKKKKLVVEKKKKEESPPRYLFIPILLKCNIYFNYNNIIPGGKALLIL